MAVRFVRSRQRWTVDFWIERPGKSPARIRKFAPVNTKRAAIRYERELRDRLLRGESDEAPSSNAITVKEFSVEFLRNWAGTYNRPVEVEQKRRVLRKHILPAMGNLRLDEIDSRVLSAYARMKLDEKLHPNTVNHHLAVISKMLHAAQEWDYIEKVPRMRKLEVPPPEWKFLQPDESDRLLAGARSSDAADHALVLTAVRTGLRISELLALRWDDVDLVASTLRVHRSRPGIGGEGGPKTKKERVVELSPKLVEVLRQHRHLRGPYVFCGRRGKPLTRDEANHILWRACRKSGLRRTSWRVLRHTFASQLRMAGRDLQEVKELLGHADIGMTLRYAHLGPTARRDAVAALDDLGQQMGNRKATTQELLPKP